MIPTRFYKAKPPRFPGFPGKRGGLILYSLHAADAVQLLTVSSHGLDQVLHGHVRFLLRSDLYWDGVCGWSADLWYWKYCLPELLADDRAHLANGLHTADQIFLHRHNVFLQKLCLLFLSVIPLWDSEKCDQKRSERIRDLPCSSIALTRSCFMEIFFIAIPP